MATWDSGPPPACRTSPSLSRPVPRWACLFSQIAFAIAGLIALIMGELVGNLLFTLKSHVNLLTLLKPGAIVLTTGMAILGYTLRFSAMVISRWRPALASGGLTLAGLVAMGLAPIPRNEYEWIENVCVYQYYAPVMAAIRGEGLGSNTTVLSSVFAVGTALAFWLFLRRDLPSNS